jgi:ribosomal protein L11 methyltransferase
LSWIALRITPQSNRDGVIAALFDSGSQGVQEDGVAVVTHFADDAPLADIERAVRIADPAAEINFSPSLEVDYSEWRASVGLHRIGELVIAPPWLADAEDLSKTIVIDPAMAFGTGEHQSTRGVMRLMQAVIRRGDFVADLGAGSAVLSIAAAKLGAGRVAAIELDHDSIDNAERNVEANGVADRIEVIEGDAVVLLPLIAPVRVVLANIISSVIIPLLPLMRAALTPDGKAIIAGIVVDERPMMERALGEGAWQIERDDVEDAWWSALIAPR